MKKLFVSATILLLLAAGPLLAQTQPVVYAVLFYSPYCSHCHEVITNHLPGIQERFGDQLQVLFIDVTTQGGQMLAQSAYTYYGIPADGQVVPMMIIGDQILTGSYDIPAQMPGMVEAGLAQGGIDLPTFPGLREVLAQSQATEAAMIAMGTQVPGTVAETAAGSPDALDVRLAADPVANVAALVVLAALAASLITVIVLRPLSNGLARAARLIALVGGLALTVSLIAQSDSLTAPLAGASLIVLVVSGILFLRGSDDKLVLPVTLVGLVDAGYLSYVELTQTAAACGVVGDCNAVQQSPYAQIFGIPIGLIGLVGYAVVLVIWLIDQRFSHEIYGRLLFWMALAGTAFSLYLTFVELYVIGAICAWCLLSAVMMVALLWLVAPVAQPAQPRRSLI